MFRIRIWVAAFILISSISLGLQAQQYGNEWIDYEQHYFKLKIHKDGMYRIDYNTLNSAFLNNGLSLTNVHPSWFQLFARGQQQYIYVKGEYEPDGIFDEDDYIEFYAIKNDGWYDEGFFKNGEVQANPNVSLINDTATYFLTWSSSAGNNRMTVETDVNFSGYTASPYFYAKVRKDYANAYFFGATDNDGITAPEYTSCEGWFDGGISLGQSKSYNLSCPNRYNTSESAQISLLMLGQSNPPHHLRLTYLDQVFDTVFNGFRQIPYSNTMPNNQIGSDQINFSLASVDDLNSDADRSTVSYMEIKYPHTFNLENKQEFKLFIPNSTDDKSYIEITNFNINTGEELVFYDLTNHRRIQVVNDNTIIKALIPNSGSEKECYICGESYVNAVEELLPLHSNSTQFNDFKSLYSQSTYFMLTNKLLYDEAFAYQSYRNSTMFETALIDVSELYEQFAYGINLHPLAIKSFINYAYQEFDSLPQYVFLIGKGYPSYYSRYNSSNFGINLVPGFGYPPCDNLFASGLMDNTYDPKVAIGRLAAQNEEHVELYLNKMMEYEMSQSNAEEWMKNVLHFGGGSDVYQQSQFSGYLKNYENIIEDTLFGGYVRTFLKTSPDPIQFNQSDSLKNIINNGVSIMTFFGHAAGIGFDQSIDDINNYNNQGKYPFLVANSCWAGDIFNTTETTSENFVLVADKGMIGFLASITVSLPSPLNFYSEQFYRNAAYKNYGNSVGLSIMKTMKYLQQQYPGNENVKRTAQLMTLHGDPALKINSHSAPDFVVEDNSVYFNPLEISTEVDSFVVNIEIVNIGRAVGGEFTVKCERIFPDGTSEVFLRDMVAVKYKDTLQIKMPINREKGVGLNQMSIDIDYNDIFQELSENNNFVSVNFVIKSADVIPVYPYEYAIVPQSNFQLMASSADPFSEGKDYIFQIDTTDAFNSPLLVEQKVTNVFGLISCNPSTSFLQNKVYYWRVRLDSAFSTNPVWRSSSFQYVPNKEGWAQSHFYQFAKDDYQYVNYNRESRSFDFVNNMMVITSQNGYNVDLNSIWYRVNSTLYEYRSCAAEISDGGMKISVFNPVSGKPWVSPYPGASGAGIYGNFHCYERPSYEFEFATNASNNPLVSTEEWLQRIENFIDTIPDGHLVFVMSYLNVHTENYPESLFQAFEKLGSNYIRSIGNGNCMILFGEKQEMPHPGAAHEEIGNENGVLINLTDSFSTNWNEGFVATPLIGPASQWQTATWSVKAENTDSVRLSIIGVSIDGNSDTLFSNISTNTKTVDLSNISSQSYPYLKLMVYMSDDSLHTPAQMKEWQVFYQGIPESAIDPASAFYFHKDTLMEGDNVKFSTAIRNISSYDMDSLLVKYWIIDKNRTMHSIDYSRSKPLLAKQVFIDTIEASTKGLAGVNSLWIEVNPNNDQLEQYHFNNIGELFFTVEQDKTNPLLDVTFDGIHILNGDIVSAKPQIQISLKDENLYLPMNDTSLLRVFIKSPTNETAKEIYFYENGIETMRFYTSDEHSKACKIEYDAEFPEDGIYELLVQAKDPTGNLSGSNDYKIAFEVINKSSITKLMNWPNPFSNATHFVFTLTGSELPDFFNIQIITVTGKLVKEIGLDELGPIHIGRNITQYAWDGTDDYGDPLANGVYLYRVITKINGSKIENRSSGADKYFTKEFGKMYLMR